MFTGIITDLGKLRSVTPGGSARLVIETRYDTHAPQDAGMWFQIELPEPTEIVGLQLDQGKSANDYPRGYKVELSTDGTKWGKPVAQGKGNSGITEIQFDPRPAKFIRITQTGSVKGNFWSIHELEILLPPRSWATMS